VEVGENDSAVWLIVEDNGPGLPDSQAMAVFQPFRSTKSGGLGLGLLSVRASTEAGNGKLEVNKSELGGARFQITWPKQAPASDPARPDTAKNSAGVAAQR
jgi:signal transduction histidine kinase